MWLMLQQPAPEDFVIATGEQHSVREFVTAAAAELGRRAGLGRRATPTKSDASRRSLRDATTRSRRARSSCASTAAIFARPRSTRCWAMPRKARTKLGWTPEISFPELVAEMVREDLRAAERDALVEQHGHTVHKRNDG